MYVCPKCQKQLKNKHSLDEHLKRVHKAELAGDKASHEHSNKAEDFKLSVPDSQKITYKCGACKAELDGEVSPCPHCGAELTWG